jgi:hypothetical protein
MNIPIEVMRNQVRKYAGGGTVTPTQDFDTMASDYAKDSGYGNETPEERAKRGAEGFPKFVQGLGTAPTQNFDTMADEYAKASGHGGETPEERAKRGGEGFPKFVQGLGEKQKWEATVQKVLVEAIAGAEKTAEVAQQNVSATALEAAHLKTAAANEALANATSLAEQANKKLADLKQAQADRAAQSEPPADPFAMIGAGGSIPQAVDTTAIDPSYVSPMDAIRDEFEGDPAALAAHEKFLAGQAEDERLSAIRQAEDTKMMEGLNAKSEASMRKAAEYEESLQGGNPALPAPAAPALGQQAVVAQPMPVVQPAPTLGQQPATQPPAGATVSTTRAPTLQPAPMTGMQSIMKSYTDKRNALNAQQQKILDNLESRIDQPANSWFALAKGFGAPTTTGSFHEAFGKAIGSYSDQQIKTTEQLQALAKMRMELAQNQMKQTGTDASLSLMDEYSKPQGGEVGGAASVGSGLGGGRSLGLNSSQIVRLMQLDPKFGEDALKVVNAETAQQVATAPYHNQKPEYYPTSRGMTLMLPIHYEKYVGLISRGDVAGAEKYLGSVTPQLNAGASMPTVSGEDAAMLSGLTPQQQVAWLESRNRLKEQHDSNQERAETARVNAITAQQNAETLRLAREEQTRKSLETLSPQEKIDYEKVVIPARDKATNATAFIGAINQLREIVKRAPSGTLYGGVASTAGRLAGHDSSVALQELDSVTKGMISMAQRAPGSVSDFDARGVLSSLGNVADITKTRDGRLKILDAVEKSSLRQLKESGKIIDYFELHKKAPPIDVTGGKSHDSGSKTVTKKFNVIEGPNKGKILYQYSDGTKEYK